MQCKPLVLSGEMNLGSIAGSLAVRSLVLALPTLLAVGLWITLRMQLLRVCWVLHESWIVHLTVQRINLRSLRNCHLSLKQGFLSCMMMKEKCDGCPCRQSRWNTYANLLTDWQPLTCIDPGDFLHAWAAWATEKMGWKGCTCYMWTDIHLSGWMYYDALRKHRHACNCIHNYQLIELAREATRSGNIMYKKIQGFYATWPSINDKIIAHININLPLDLLCSSLVYRYLCLPWLILACCVSTLVSQ